MTTVEQRDAAREKANRVRQARVALKKDIYEKRVTVSSVILLCPPDVRTMRVSQLLNAQWRWGPRKVRGLLWSLRISDYQTVEGVTDRQREEIALRLAPFEATA